MKILDRWIRVLLLASAFVGLILQPAFAQPTKQGHRAPKLQLASSANFAPNGDLWLVGLNTQGQLFFQIAPKGDVSRWSEAKVVSTVAEKISADGENHPKVVFGKDGVVVISYTQPLENPYSGFIRMVRSGDGGQSFSAPFTVHADRQEITHRFESIGFDHLGNLHTLWIDKRDLELQGKGYRGAAIYRNVSQDGGLTFGPDIKVADHSCECCKISLLAGKDGTMHALWRHVFAPSIRDHAFASFDAQAGAVTAPARASFDEWSINACPHHGPGLALRSTNGFHTVWFGVRDGVQGVRYGQLDSQGQPVGSVLLVPDVAAEHADIRTDANRVAIVWRSTDATKTRLRAWLSTDGGANFSLRELGEVQDDNDHPRLAQSGSKIVVLWRNTKGVNSYELAF